MATVKRNYEVALDKVEQMPRAATRTIARALAAEHPERFKDIEAARRAVNYARGTIGPVNRARRGIAEPPLPKAFWRPSCPPSLAQEWKPRQIDGPCRVLSISDLHIPYHDQRVIEAVIKYAKKKHRPDVLLINGDYGDFYQLSRFDRSPKRSDFAIEVDYMLDGLEWLASQFPKARRIFKRGNHDERWDRYVWNHAPMFCNLENVRLGAVLELNKWGFEEVGDEPVMAGLLPILHGHELPKGMASPVNAARGAFMRTLTTCMVGHYHRPSTHPESDMWKKQTVCWSQGCLCDLRPEYARVNKWGHGFAVIDVEKDNRFDVHNYQIADGEVRAA